MSKTAIRIENLGKRYFVDHERKGKGGGYRTLRESLAEMAAMPMRKIWGLGVRGSGLGGEGNGETKEEFWALKDVSFEVQPGEVVGIIGRNGAGKSTLLKILSRITKPTTGRVELNGRIGSLLEVGTGFHPELTGRENVYLNGSILGMKKMEIDRRFDEIVDFSGVEQFLDTPVKRYSSGMYVRLAFAVAAHLDPEILIIDEVLAVGDADFQKKCLGAMASIATRGRTVLFVSHNMSAVRRLCNRVLHLHHGGVKRDGTSHDALQQYMSDFVHFSQQTLQSRSDRAGTGRARIVDIQVFSTLEDGTKIPPQTGRPTEFAFLIQDAINAHDIIFAIYDAFGALLTVFDTRHTKTNQATLPSISSRFSCTLNALPLTPGHYRINVALYRENELLDHVEGAATVRVHDGIFFGTLVTSSTAGAFLVDHEWHSEHCH